MGDTVGKVANGIDGTKNTKLTYSITHCTSYLGFSREPVLVTPLYRVASLNREDGALGIISCCCKVSMILV